MIKNSIACGRSDLEDRRVSTAWPVRVTNTLLLWLARAQQRRTLDSFNDHVLKDIGLSRVDVEREFMKRFWRG